MYEPLSLTHDKSTVSFPKYPGTHNLSELPVFYLRNCLTCVRFVHRISHSNSCLHFSFIRIEQYYK